MHRPRDDAAATSFLPCAEGIRGGRGACPQGHTVADMISQRRGAVPKRCHAPTDTHPNANHPTGQRESSGRFEKVYPKGIVGLCDIGHFDNAC